MCDLPTPGTEPVSPALAGEFSITGPTRGCPVMLLMAIKDGYHLSNSVTSDSVTPWTAACQASLSITVSWSLLKFMSIEWVMPSNHPILCRPLLLPPSIFPSIRVFSNESALCIRWPKDCSFSISLSNEYSGLISFRIVWFDLLAAQGTLNQFFGPQPSLLSNSHICT